MATTILPVGEIILTNERGLIGAGYDYGLRSGPDNVFDQGSFGLPASDMRRLRFDHCFIIYSGSIPWAPAVDDLKNFFRFVLAKESGEIVVDVTRDFSGMPKYTLESMVHYANGQTGIYNIPAEREKTPSGRYTLTCSVNPSLVICQPARFFLEINMENIWMYAEPSRFPIIVPFVEGMVTRQELNPAVPWPISTPVVPPVVPPVEPPVTPVVPVVPVTPEPAPVVPA